MIRIKQKWGLAFLLFLSLVYILVFLFSLNSKDNSVKEIYFGDRLTTAHRILIDKYNKVHEGKIKVIPIDFSNFDFNTNERKELLARSLRGRGDGLDLLAVDVIWVQRFARWCETLDKYFPKEEQDKILDLTKESCYFNGALVAVPLDISIGVMIYRDDLIKNLDKNNKIRDLLSKGDITWKEFIDLGEKLNLKDKFYIFTAADYEGLICVFMELLYSLEPNYFDVHGFNFNTSSAKKALEMLTDFVNKYNLSPKIVTEFTEVPSYSYFMKNDNVFIRGWQNYNKDFEEASVDLKKEKSLRQIPVPHFSGGRKVSILGGWNLMIPKFSENKEEVVDFVKFLISESSQELIYKEAGLAPVLKRFYTDEYYLKKYPEIKDLKKIYDTGMYRPANINYTKYSKIMAHYFALAIGNEISVKDALNMATQDIRLDKVLVK
jgi:multiple sugar transport system substrate-binding protein